MVQTRLTRFGMAVRNAREARKLSQQELAQKLNMNKNTIMEIELGRSNPKGETIFLIAAELHISIDSILYSSTEQPNSVSMEVLDFFSSKSNDESKRYVEVCRQIESLYTKESPV